MVTRARPLAGSCFARRGSVSNALARSILTIWEKLLLKGRPREVPVLARAAPPCIVSTDAQLRNDRPPRTSGFICTSSGEKSFFIHSFSDAWTARHVDLEEFCITQAEAASPGIAAATWRHMLRSEAAIFFVDNQGATGALTHGSSPAGDLSSIVATVWEEFIFADVRPWFEYVPSACNVADPGSRGSKTLAMRLGAIEARAILPAAWQD